MQQMIMGKTITHCLLSRPVSEIPIQLLGLIVSQNGINLEIKDHLGQKVISYLVPHLSHSPNIQGLIALDKLINNNNSNINSIDIDAEDNNGETAILKAIRKDLPRAVFALANKSAGRKLTLADLRLFFDKYSTTNQWKASVEEMKKCLVKVNYAWALETSIKSITGIY